MAERPTLDPGQPRVHPDDYLAAGLGEFHRPTEPQVVTDPARDERIASQARAALERAEMIDADRIHVQVINAEVILSGIADNRFVREKAEESASEAEGIEKILNKIVIQPPPEEPGPILSTHEPGTRDGSTQRS